MVAHQVFRLIFALGPALRPTWPTSARRLLPSDARAIATHPVGIAAPCTAACRALLRAGSQTEELPGRLPSPLINLAPRRLLSLLHSLKRPVLNFHRRRSVASSDPSPRRPDAIKGARSHGHFTRSVLPHLAPLIHAPCHPTPSTMPCSIPLHRAARFWPR
jgi:hypothetical protein